MARKRFTAEFKARVVRDAMREANTLNAVAAKHGVHPSQLREWRKQASISRAILPAVFRSVRSQCW